MGNSVVMGLLGLIVTGWVVSFIASVLGRGKAAEIINLITNLLCFTTAIGTIAAAISAFKKLVGGF